ncbi:ABC transporter substrate-binding protein [Pyrobaculum aerophilum]|uniref:Leucine-binding protein domain-containing protein n=1 Tax=Pyrobaculum aerophilum TaxID=13773 RepID=A0A371QZS4_9CREN|nr:ABC transporter substrate-binding protein [Pyrobaculum aerophilum]RFA96158.1 hypothetical protein CGL51_05680 [Pyrobaculum aerophilum]RFA96297.1 hypothetical protein CGL52_10975 [Pyrobaculum aerophilum]
MASKGLIVGVIIVAIVLIAIAALMMQAPQTTPSPTQTTPSPSPSPSPTPTPSPTIKIAAILPKSGDLASYGKRAEVAFLMAVEDFEKQYGVNVDYVVEDTATDPNIAFEKLQSLYARGYRFVIGPMTSAEVRQIKGYADTQGILLISPSSTAPELAVDDNVLRFVPTDVFQSKAIAAYLAQSGAKCVVLVWRGDPWGDGLATATKEELGKLGIEVAGEIRYDPKAPDFSPYVSQMATAVRQCVNKVGRNATFVELIAFAEAKSFLNLAEQYPELMEIKWVGSDGTAQLTEIIQEACEPGSKVYFDSPVFAPAETARYQEFVNRYKQRAGEDPDAYSSITYDATFTLLLALKKIIDEGKEPTAALVKQYMVQILKDYQGVTGKIELDAAGDRASGNYNIWRVVKTDGACEWKNVAFWDSTTGMVTKT